MNDPRHPYAYKNLAFIKNLSAKYEEAIAVCNMAKDFLPKTHDCHSHWAFALMKRSRYVEAVRKIAKGAEKNPRNVDNWIVWAHLLRQANTGKLQSALQKILVAEEIEPENEVVMYERRIIEGVIKLDKQIHMDVSLAPRF